MPESLTSETVSALPWHLQRKPDSPSGSPYSTDIFAAGAVD